MGQLVRVPEGRYSAQQLLWSKAETKVLKCLVAAQSSSNPKGSGTRMRGGWGSGAERGQAADSLDPCRGQHMPTSLIPPPLGLEMCRFKTRS